MSSLLFILLCFWGGLIIHLWFYSDFWTFYLKLFKKFIPSKLYNWFLIEEYLNNTDKSYDNYPEFVYEKRSYGNNFLIVFLWKLLSCPLCFTFWVSFFMCLIIQNFLYLGIFFFVLRLIDFILKFILKKHFN